MLAGSDFIFHSQIDRLVSSNQLRNKYETERIYAPYKDELDLSIDESVTTPIARRVIDGFNNGASLINYIGHGGGGIWSDSRMLDFEDPEQNLTNISQLPLVISMTCFTGAFDGTKNSLAEELLRSRNGGAIAVIGATSVGPFRWRLRSQQRNFRRYVQGAYPEYWGYLRSSQNPVSYKLPRIPRFG